MLFILCIQNSMLSCFFYFIPIAIAVSEKIVQGKPAGSSQEESIRRGS